MRGEGGGGGQREVGGADRVEEEEMARVSRTEEGGGAALSLFLPFLSFLFGSRSAQVEGVRVARSCLIFALVRSLVPHETYRGLRTSHRLRSCSCAVFDTRFSIRLGSIFASMKV